MTEALDPASLPGHSPRHISPPKQNPPENKADPQRHSRKCQVCSHPEREAIEWAFINWRSPNRIASAYKLSGDSLYRHANALNLYDKRRSSLRSVLDNILERGVETAITGDTILRAVRAHTCLTDQNTWIEPASQVLFSSQRAPVPQPIEPPTIDIAAESIDRREPIPIISNRKSPELEMDLSPALTTKGDVLIASQEGGTSAGF